MNYNILLYVIKVAKYKNFSKAAESIFLSQPALSQSINRLEQKLGVVLFNRNKNSVDLTEAGQIFIEKAEQIIKLMDDLENSMKNYTNKDLNKISIGVSQFYGKYFLPNVIKTLNKRYPHTYINILESESKILEEYLVKGEIDLVIVPLPIKSNEIHYERLYDEEIILAVNSKNNILTSSVSNGLVDLSYYKNSDFVLLNKGFKLRNLAEQICLKEHLFKPNVVFESENLDILNSLVSNNIGVSFLPSNITKLKNVEYLQFKSKHNHRQIVLATTKHNMKKFKIESLANEIKNVK